MNWEQSYRSYSNLSQYQRQYLREHLKELSELEFQTLVKRYWERLTIQEIAADLRLHWKTTDNLLHSGMKRLKSSCHSDTRLALGRNYGWAA